MPKTDTETFFSALSESLSAKDMMLSALQATIAAEISVKRIEMDLSQTQFAEFMGVSQSLVSRWEGGETNFTLSTLVDIADKLNIKIQSPFVTAPAPVYYTSKAKIVPFPGHAGSWNSLRSKRGEYENVDDLIEM